ncbi:hypothetical protein Tco_1060870, partial [Tanacetum coccineum]
MASLVATARDQTASESVWCAVGVSRLGERRQATAQSYPMLLEH